MTAPEPITGVQVIEWTPVIGANMELEVDPFPLNIKDRKWGGMGTQGKPGCYEGE